MPLFEKDPVVEKRIESLYRVSSSLFFSRCLHFSSNFCHILECQRFL